MRFIYPSLTAPEYLDSVCNNKDSGNARINKHIRLINALSFMGVLSLCFILVSVLAILLNAFSPWFVLLLSLILGAFVFWRIRAYIYGEARESAVGDGNPVDKELFAYYRLCDKLRVSGMQKVTMHITDDICSLSFCYKNNGKEVKGELDMSWHLNPGIDDIVVDLERREISIPQKLYETARGSELNTGLPVAQGDNL